MGDPNLDGPTVDAFGEEWATYDQSARRPQDLAQTFDRYFSTFPWDALPPGARGFDAGCGSGRWAALVAPRVGALVAIDPSDRALGAAQAALADAPNAWTVRGSAGALPLADASMDFGYCIGVLHHTPDPAAGMADCVRCLKPGAPLLVYLYYALDHRPAWFRAAWQASDRLRRRVSHLPPHRRHQVATAIAATAYYPLARAAPLLRRVGVRHAPLAAYADKPFSVMRTDAFDRFATPLELRFAREEVRALMEASGLADVRFRDDEPFWCAVGVRA